jgi:CelD/BcsL family acetyltransferase involved in cellulose biosynthesis
VNVEEIADLEGLEALQTEWAALLACCSETAPFVSPRWLLPWWRHLGGGELWVLALRDRGALLGLAPLFIYQDGGLRRLALLGSGISDELDVVARPEHAEDVAVAVLAHVHAHASRWDAASFTDLPPGSALVTAPCPLPRSAGQDDACHVLELPATAAEFRRSMRPHHARNLRRARTLLEARGRVRVERAAPETASAGIEALFALHAARWRARGQIGVLASPALQQFHRESVAGLADEGWLRLRTLWVGASVAAVLYGFARGRRAFAYLSGFDPAFAQGSPGTLLTALAIEDSIDEGAATYDFLRGNEAHKLAWGVRRVPRCRVDLSPCASC